MRIKIFLTLACFLSTFDSGATAQSCTQMMPGEVGHSNHAMAYLNVTASASHLDSAIRAGAGAWNSNSCNSGGDDFPLFVATPMQPRIDVFLVNGFGAIESSQWSACADFTWLTVDRSRARINLYTQLRDPTERTHSCQNDAAHPGLVADRMAHELGHYLNLGDVGSGCGTGYIMSGDFLEPAGNTYNFKDKQINSQECARADQENSTPQEPYTEGDTSAPGGSDPSNPNPGGTTSPILIDLDKSGFQLSSLDEGVYFDIDADGIPDWLSWTREGELDGFLVFDRDLDGIIKDGTELFGDSTPFLLQPGVAPHGFEALAEFDRAALGGDQNGRIDSGDWAYRTLRVWIDWNHDGQTGLGELLSLEEAGVVAIDLEFRESLRTDPYGNILQYRSKTWITNDSNILPTWAVDVFFVVD